MLGQPRRDREGLLSSAGIIAAVGGNHLDDVVLARALEIAAERQARLDVVHVLDLPGCDGDAYHADNLVGQSAMAVRDRLGAALASVNAAGTEVVLHFVVGTPALRLIEACEELRPMLVVMRVHETRNFIEKALLGSTTDRMIAAGVAPVLVVKRAVKRPYQGVLLATDGTDDAAGALAFIVPLFPRATRILAQVVRIAPQLEAAMLRAGSGQPALTAYLQTLIKAARDHLRALALTVVPRPATRVLRGDPTKALARASRDPKIDLIVLGPGRTSLVRRAFIGSVTRKLLRQAACDVLIWRPRLPGDEQIVTPPEPPW